MFLGAKGYGDMRYKYYVNIDDVAPLVGVAIDTLKDQGWDCFRDNGGADLRDEEHCDYNLIHHVSNDYPTPDYEEVTYREFLEWLDTDEDIPQREDESEYMCLLSSSVAYRPVVVHTSTGTWHVIETEEDVDLYVSAEWDKFNSERLTVMLDEQGYREVSIDEFLSHLGL